MKVPARISEQAPPRLRAVSRNPDVEPTQSQPSVGWQALLPPSQTYPAGTELFTQGSSARETYYINSGAVKLVWADATGRELIANLRYPGSFLGMAPVILNANHPVSAITLSPSKLSRLPAELFHNLMKTNHAFSAAVQEMLSQEVCDQTERLGDLGCLSSRQRVKRMLWQIVQLNRQANDRDKEEVRLLLPLRQYEIASVLAVSPEHLSRVFKQLRQEGIIRWHKGWLIVPNVSRLQPS